MRGLELHYPTIEDVLTKYQQEDKPLNNETIEVCLAPLAGTSFDKQARRAFRDWKRISLPLTAHSLFWAFFYQEFFRVGEPTSKQRDDVKHMLDMLSLSQYMFENEYIQTLSYLKRNELLLQETRQDIIYTDSTHTTEAFHHEADQWRFYKDGHYLQGISISSFYPRSMTWGVDTYTILSEGLIETRLMADKQYPLLLFVHPNRQVNWYNSRRIGISPHFSLRRSYLLQESSEKH